MASCCLVTRQKTAQRLLQWSPCLARAPAKQTSWPSAGPGAGAVRMGGGHVQPVLQLEHLGPCVQDGMAGMPAVLGDQHL